MRKRLNLLDWILIVLLVAAVAGGSVWFVRSRNSRTDPVGVICLVRISPVEEALLNGGGFPAAGDPVRLPGTEEEIGTVLAVSVAPRMEITAENGVLRLTDSPGRYTAEVTVRVRTDGAHRVGNIRMAAGGKADLIFGGFYAAGCEILTLEEAEHEGEERK